MSGCGERKVMVHFRLVLLTGICICQLIDESCQQLLFTCEKIHHIWMECYQWINMEMTLQECAVTQVLQHQQSI